jgi:rhodanese-related sulfurtransferase
MSNTLSENSNLPRGRGMIVALLILLGGAIPLIAYAVVFGLLPTATPQEAKVMLLGEEGSNVLVDVRSPEIFAERHLDGAINWPVSEISAAKGPGDIPPQFREKTLLLICDVGWKSSRAVEHLATVGQPRVCQVRGGIQEWIHAFTAERVEIESEGDSPADMWSAKSIAPKGGLYDRFRVAGGGIEELPFRVSPPVEQMLAVVAFFFFKPIYELLSLAVIVLLWKSREPDLTALRWGMIFFFLGENACAVNYFAFKETSYLAEYLHSYGMLLCFAFVVYAFLEGFDRRVLFFGDAQQRCAAHALCAKCSKSDAGVCGLVQMFRALIPGLTIAAFMLPCADWHNTANNTVVFGRIYNYAHLWIYQVYENWFCGLGAAAMLAISLLLVCVKKENAVAWAKIAFAAGIGPFVFGGLRMILGSAYDRNRVWFLFWEETTELLFLIFICCLLCIFREALLKQNRV